MIPCINKHNTQRNPVIHSFVYIFVAFHEPGPVLHLRNTKAR